MHLGVGQAHHIAEMFNPYLGIPTHQAGNKALSFLYTSATAFREPLPPKAGDAVGRALNHLGNPATLQATPIQAKGLLGSLGLQRLVGEPVPHKNSRMA